MEVMTVITETAGQMEDHYKCSQFHLSSSSIKKFVIFA